MKQRLIKSYEGQSMYTTDTWRNTAASSKGVCIRLDSSVGKALDWYTGEQGLIPGRHGHPVRAYVYDGHGVIQQHPVRVYVYDGIQQHPVCIRYHGLSWHGTEP